MPAAIAQEAPAPGPSPDPPSPASDPLPAPQPDPLPDPQPDASQVPSPELSPVPQPDASQVPSPESSPVPLPDPYDTAAPPKPAEPLTEEQAVAAAQASAAAERFRVSGFAGGELSRASTRVAQLQFSLAAAEQELAAAQAAEQALIAAHGAAVGAAADARRDLGNLARLAYTSGPTEWTLIETFLDADNPADALRRASVSQLVAERQGEQWKRAVESVELLDAQQAAVSDRVAAAATSVRSAELDVSAARDQVRSITAALAAGGIPGQDGGKAVSQLCRGLEIAQCEPSGWGEGKLTRDAVWLMRVIRQKWPEVETSGGYRSTDAFPDHPMGRAVDVMLPGSGRTSSGAALGDEMATYFMTNADSYGVMYLIWHQRIWMNGRDPVAPPAQWRAMQDRGDWTSNHMDHVHITVSTGVSGSDIHEVMQHARG